MNRSYRNLPRQVLTLLLQTDSWMVGSATKWYLEGGEEPKDIDIIVAPSRFLEACKIVNHITPSFNSFGGLKLEIEGRSVDIWPQELGTYIERVKTGIAIKLMPYKVVRWSEE